MPDAPKPPPRPSRPADLPTPDPAPTKLMETVSKMSLEPRGPSFSLKTCQAFDDLMDLGYAVELEDGSAAAAGDFIAKGFHVELNCVAKIWDGASTVTKEFANGTVAFVVGKNQVVSGLDAAVQKLKVSQKATVTCSPAKAYGGAGNPPSVPPNSFIVFSVEVVRAGPATAATATSSSSSGTQMLLDSGVANTRKVKGTENRRDSRIILVSGEKDKDSEASTPTGGKGPGPTPPKPAKPSPTGEPKIDLLLFLLFLFHCTHTFFFAVSAPPTNSSDPGSPESLALNDNIHDA